VRITFYLTAFITTFCVALAATSVAAGRLKPDASQIVFLSQGRGNQTIRAYDFDAQRTIQLSRAPLGFCCGPVVWSPDRQQLVVTFTPNSLLSEYYVVTRNGRFRRSLSTLNPFTSIDTLAWSPDGRFLTFEVRGTNSVVVYRTEVNSTDEAIPLTDSSGVNFGAAWSPDGEQIAYSALQATGSAISVMNADGSNQRQLSSITASFHHPSWSPDGTHIAFLENSGSAWNIRVINSSGSGLLPLTRDARVVSALEWSPDGERIVYTGIVDDNEEIFVADLSSGSVSRLTHTTAGEISPTWSPDGRLILFTIREDNRHDIGVVSTDGSGYRRIVESPERDFGAVWLAFGER
jgi:Tol biopolymer transport system component